MYIDINFCLIRPAQSNSRSPVLPLSKSRNLQTIAERSTKLSASNPGAAKFPTVVILLRLERTRIQMEHRSSPGRPSLSTCQKVSSSTGEETILRAIWADISDFGLPSGRLKPDCSGPRQSITFPASLQRISQIKWVRGRHSYFWDAICALCPFRIVLWTA